MTDYTPSYTRITIPEGRAGTWATLQGMLALARQAPQYPAIQYLASVLPTPTELDTYIRTNWIVLPDPEWTEWVRGPADQLNNYSTKGYYEGDCDDAATFVAGICLTSGLNCRFVAYRFVNNADFSHVNVEVEGVPIDPIYPIDQLPITSGVVETMELEVS